MLVPARVQRHGVCPKIYQLRNVDICDLWHDKALLLPLLLQVLWLEILELEELGICQNFDVTLDPHENFVDRLLHALDYLSYGIFINVDADLVELPCDSVPVLSS